MPPGGRVGGRLLKGGAALVGACLLVAVALSARGAQRPTGLAADVEYVSGAASRKAGEGNSQLADLVDSPLLLVRKKVNDYLKMDDPEDALAARERMGGPVNVPGQKKAKCTGLKCTDGVWQNDYMAASKVHMEAVMGDQDPKLDPANKAFDGEWGDQQQPMTIGNVVKELKDNLTVRRRRALLLQPSPPILHLFLSEISQLPLAPSPLQRTRFAPSPRPFAAATPFRVPGMAVAHGRGRQNASLRGLHIPWEARLT
jgi:hypothetical protein